MREEYQQLDGSEFLPYRQKSLKRMIFFKCPKQRNVRQLECAKFKSDLYLGFR